MSYFERAKSEITKDVDKIFSDIQIEISSKYSASNNDDLKRVRETINRYIPVMIVNKNLLLFDTLINYLAKDATISLENFEIQIANNFYEQDQKWIDELSIQFRNTVRESKINFLSDLRIAYSIAIGSIVFVISGLFSKIALDIEFPVLLPLLLFSVCTSFFVYQKTAPLAMAQVKRDTDRYLQKAHNLTAQRLQKVAISYEQKFLKLLQSQSSYF